MASVIGGSDNFDSSLPFVVEQGSNANGHYRKWSNGFIEQWITGSASTTGAVNTYPIPFVTEVVSSQVTSRSAAAFSIVSSTGNPSLTSVTAYAASGSPHTVYIEVKGY